MSKIVVFTQDEVAAMIDHLETFLIMLGSLAVVPTFLLSARLKAEQFLRKLRTEGQLVDKPPTRRPSDSAPAREGQDPPRMSELVALAEGLSDASGVELEKALVATTFAVMLSAGEVGYAAS